MSECVSTRFVHVLSSRTSSILRSPHTRSNHKPIRQTIAALTQLLPGMLGGLGKTIPGTAGVLFPGMQAKIVRDSDPSQGVVDCDFDEIGELWLKGENVSPGYWNNEKASKDTFTSDGWLKTGDRFRVNREGYFL